MSEVTEYVAGCRDIAIRGRYQKSIKEARNVYYAAKAVALATLREEVSAKPKFDRVSYQREYMRAYRARKRESKRTGSLPTIVVASELNAEWEKRSKGPRNPMLSLGGKA